MDSCLRMVFFIDEISVWNTFLFLLQLENKEKIFGLCVGFSYLNINNPV